MDARTRAELQARAATAQAAWQRSARQTEVALVAWQRSAVAAARAAMLAEQSFVSRAQVEAAVLDLQRDERAWQAAQAAERTALHELEQVRVILATASGSGAQRRAVRLGSVEPSRPGQQQDLRVLRVMQPHEAVLPAGAAVMEVGDVTRPEVVLPLLSQDALRIPVGSRVRLGAWSGGGPATPEVLGRVRLVEPMATTKVSALGLEEQRVNLVIDPDQPLPPGDGYTVRAQVVLRHADQALQVPVSAVFPMPGKPTAHAVYALEGSRARLVEVELQGRSRAWAWIGQGLQTGQAVVLYPPAALYDGARVRAGR
jgi:HlyD family secretion protein